MAAHKFAVGRRVEFFPDLPNGAAPRGIYVVVRHIPSETRDPQYRIQDTRGGHERVVRESRLRQA